MNKICDKCRFKDGRIVPIDLIDGNTGDKFRVIVCVDCKNNYDFEMMQIDRLNETFKRLRALRLHVSNIIEEQVKGNCEYKLEKLVLEQNE